KRLSEHLHIHRLELLSACVRALLAAASNAVSLMSGRSAEIPQKAKQLIPEPELSPDNEEPLNIVTDSQYAEKVVLHIETAEFIPDESELTSLFIRLQDIIRNRKHPLYITHIRSHTGLPGPLAQGTSEEKQPDSGGVALARCSPPVCASSLTNTQKEFIEFANSLQILSTQQRVLIRMAVGPDRKYRQDKKEEEAGKKAEEKCCLLSREQDVMKRSSSVRLECELSLHCGFHHTPQTVQLPLVNYRYNHLPLV
ncbi:hypothetical protein STEG23_002432, partial [Scotinomys teguina]